jgi:hypothetical protein
VVQFLVSRRRSNPNAMNSKFGPIRFGVAPLQPIKPVLRCLDARESRLQRSIIRVNESWLAVTIARHPLVCSISV